MDPGSAQGSSCADDENFVDAGGSMCAAYQGWSCDDTSLSGGTTSEELKTACPLSCGICSGEFRAGCGWDAAFPFGDCCASDAFELADGTPCAFGTTQYGACCAERECVDDPDFLDEGGFPCADWQDSALDCFASGYSAGGQDALLANCGMSCASCDTWRGDGNCWSARPSPSPSLPRAFSFLA